MTRSSQPTTPLFVRLPAEAATRLQRTAERLEVPKKDLVADLVLRHLDGEAAETSRVGRAAFYEYREAEVLTLDEAADFLKVPVVDLEAMVARGAVPARRIGESWRLSRSALVAWLGTGAEAG